MPVLSASEILFVLCLAAFTVAAAVTDIRTRRIPNALTAPMCLAGLLFQILSAGTSGLWNSLAGFGAGFGILFVLWMVGAAGGGDVKLMGALGTWLGGRATLQVLFVSLVLVMIGTGCIVVCGIVKHGWKGIRRPALAAQPAATSAAGQSQVRSRRRVMAFAAPVGIATWWIVALQVFGRQGF